MKRHWLLLLGIIMTQSALAALPPQYQNEKDLDVMVTFVKGHPTVLSGLRSIDLHGQTVYFGDGCEAQFGRESIERPPGWVGPASLLKFRRSTCPVD